MRGRIALVVLASLLTVAMTAGGVLGDGGWNAWIMAALAGGLLALNVAFLIREHRKRGD